MTGRHVLEVLLVFAGESCVAFLPGRPWQRRDVRATEGSYEAEVLYPKSYSLPLVGRRVAASTRAQWLADWRAISECFARFQTDTAENTEQTRLADSLNTVCADELSFMTGGTRKRASPFALSLVDCAFVAAYCEPEKYRRIRDYVLAQYVPSRMGDVSEKVGSYRVADVARAGAGSSRECRQRFFDPATPEFVAMVKAHNVEYPVKHPDYREAWAAAGGAHQLHEPCD